MHDHQPQPGTDPDPAAQPNAPVADGHASSGHASSGHGSVGWSAMAAGGLPTGDALISLVEGVQRHVQMVTGMKAEVEARSADLERRAADLQARQSELEARRTETEAALREAVEARDAAQRENSALEQRRREHEEAARWLDQREAEVRTRQEELSARASDVERRLQEIQERLTAAEGVEARGAELLRLAEGRASSLAEQERAFEDRQREAVARVNDEAMRQLEGERERANSLSRELESLRSEAESLRASLSERGSAIEGLEQRLNGLEAERGALAEKAGLYEEAVRRLQERDAGWSDLERRAAEAERTAESLRAEMGERERDMAERVARLEMLERSLTEQTARADDLSKRLEDALAAAAKAEAAPPASDPRVGELEAELRRTKEDLETALDDVERLSALAQKSRAASGNAAAAQAASAEQEKRLATAQEELRAAQARGRELEAALSEARTAAEASAQQSGALSGVQEELDRAMRVVGALQGERVRLQEELARASERAEKAEAEAASARERTPVGGHTDYPDAAAPHTAVGPAPERRKRLAAYRKALREQRGKLSQAKDLLTQRLNEVQDLNTRRAALAAETQHLEQMRTKIDQERSALMRERQQPVVLDGAPAKSSEKPARGGLAVRAAALAATLGVLAGVSWQVAGAFRHPLAVATMTLGVDESHERPTTDQTAQWQSYMKDLAQDERLLERASERFKMRGFKEWSDPAVLGGALKDALDADTALPGQVRLSLTYPGFERAALAVDTLATTMIGFANDSREVREDKLSTVIAEGAKAVGEPIEDPRLALFGAIFGGLTAFTLFAAAVVFRRSKQEAAPKERERRSRPFEQGTVVAAPVAVAPPPEPASLPQSPLPSGPNAKKVLQTLDG